MVKEIKNDNLDEARKSSYAVIDFNAVWCNPCRMLAPVLEELSEELAGEVDFYSCDVDENGALAAEFRVSSIPCVVILKDGQAMNAAVGFQPKDALRKFVLSSK